MNLSAPAISAVGRGRCRTAGRLAHREGTDLSNAAGARDRAIRGRRRHGHHSTTDGSVVVRSAWPAVRHREPTGRRPQYRHEAGVKSPADGYTLLVVGTSNTVNPSLYDKLNFNLIRDIAQVGGIIRAPYVMVVNPALPARTVPEFIVQCRANAAECHLLRREDNVSTQRATALMGMEMSWGTLAYQTELYDAIVANETN
jgi:Tripartite tricarboxylate transporter family receptor